MNDPFPTKGVGFYRGLDVTVTGGTGLIGSYAVKLLKESGARVRAICNERPRNPFTQMANWLLRYDLMDPKDAKKAVEGSDVVIACAGITGGVNLPKIDPVSYVGPASVIAMNTLHACHEAKVSKFGYLSSTTVYAPSERAVKEDDVNFSDKLYPLYRGIGYSKRFLEKLCAYYHETTKIGVGIVRPSGAYGRFDNFDERSSHVIPGMINRALKRKPEFEIWGDGGDVRDFIHAQDVARCLLMAVADKPDADPINAASGQPLTTLGLARIIVKEAGSGANIVYRLDKPTALRVRMVDISKARELLGFEPQISIKAGIRDTINWRRSQ